MKSLVRDGPRGEWGCSWRAPTTIAPMEKPALPPRMNGVNPATQNQSTVKSWAAFFAAPFLGISEDVYHDGDDEEDGDDVYDGVKGNEEGGVGVGVNFGGGDEGWKEVRVETVECEVPIKVWPGNTAFKAMDVVFDL